MRISSHAPRRFCPEPTWCFQLDCFYFYTLPPSLIFILVLAAVSEFSLAHIVFFSLTHSFLPFCLAFLLIFSLVRGILPCVLFSPDLSLSFVVSFTPFLHFLVLIYFVWVDFRSLVLFSLSTRGMSSYLCMLGMLSGCVYHRFRVLKIFGRKNFKWSSLLIESSNWDATKMKVSRNCIMKLFNKFFFQNFIVYPIF